MLCFATCRSGLFSSCFQHPASPALLRGGTRPRPRPFPEDVRGKRESATIGKDVLLRYVLALLRIIAFVSCAVHVSNDCRCFDLAGRRRLCAFGLLALLCSAFALCFVRACARLCLCCAFIFASGPARLMLLSFLCLGAVASLLGGFALWNLVVPSATSRCLYLQSVLSAALSFPLLPLGAHRPRPIRFLGDGPGNRVSATTNTELALRGLLGLVRMINFGFLHIFRWSRKLAPRPFPCFPGLCCALVHVRSSPQNSNR